MQLNVFLPATTRPPVTSAPRTLLGTVARPGTRTAFDRARELLGDRRRRTFRWAASHAELFESRGTACTSCQSDLITGRTGEGGCLSTKTDFGVQNSAAERRRVRWNDHGRRWAVALCWDEFGRHARSIWRSSWLHTRTP